jgi:hypothetical protein
MHVHTGAPRTLFATTKQGHTLLLRRYEPPEQPSYALSEYRNYLTAHPEDLPLPPEVPESFPSLDEALQSAWAHWRIPPESFQDIHLGRSVTLDFIESLRSNAMGPLSPDMSPQDMVEHLGLPDGVTPLFHNAVCWFYGSVQVHWFDGVLHGLEIDNGVGEFTSLQGWFLDGTTTRARLEAELARHGVPFTREAGMDLTVLRVRPTKTGAGFLFDFFEDNTIHALYWQRDD